jgi:hypothetical protein
MRALTFRLLLPWLLAAFACQSTPSVPAELALPPLEARRSAHWGSALSGPLAGARAPDREEALIPALLLEVLALERWPASWPQVPLEREASLVLDAGEGELLQPASRLGTRVWRVQEGALDAATTGRTRAIFSESSALPLGSTQLLEILPRAGAGGLLDELARPQRLDVAVGRDGEGSLRVLFHLEGEVLEVPHEAEDLMPGADPTQQQAARAAAMREWIGLRQPWSGGAESLSLLMGSPFAGEARALLVRIRLVPGDDSAAHAQNVAKALTLLSARASEQLERVRTREEREARRAATERALRAIAKAQNRRAALAYVATSAGSVLMGDLAAVLSEPELDRLLEGLAAAGDAERLALEDASLRWTLERVAIEFILSHADEEGLRGPWLSRMSLRVGALARSPEEVRDLVRRCAGLTAFDEALIAENRIALEDNSAAVRVRAFDWLAMRKAAPADFDPLASEALREERIEALEEQAAGKESDPP